MSKKKGKFWPRPEERPVPHRVRRKAKPPGYRAPTWHVVVKKDSRDLNVDEWMATVPGFIEMFTSDYVSNERIKLYDYQIAHMADRAIFRIVDKARQMGFSWGFACESLAKNYLRNTQTSIFISYNLDEATKKITYARNLHESIPSEFQKKLVIDNRQSLEFEEGGKRTRIISLAHRQPRGEGVDTDIYLDEFAHMMNAEGIYIATVPVLSRGSGVLTIGSTPLGKQTMHARIMDDVEKYYMFSRMRMNWWECPDLCIDYLKARKDAPTMTTEERVDRFGTDKLKEIYASMDEDQFQQEYECNCLDEQMSYYPLDMIRSCVFDYEERLALEDNIDPKEVPLAWEPIENEGGSVVMETIMSLYAKHTLCWYCDSYDISGDMGPDEQQIEHAVNMIDKLLLKMDVCQFGHHLLLGYDVGRKKNSSELSILEEIDLGDTNVHVERLSIELDNVKFRVQEAILDYCLTHLPIKCARIDKTGIGYNLAENLEDKHPRIVEGIEFNLENKADMAKNLRIRMEDRTVAIFNNPDSIKHIHSIKRQSTNNAALVYGTEKRYGKHHGDKFWSKALASAGGNMYDRAKAKIKPYVHSVGSRLFTPAHQLGTGLVKIAHGTNMLNGLPKLKKPESMFSANTKSELDFVSSMFFDPNYYG